MDIRQQRKDCYFLVVDDQSLIFSLVKAALKAGGFTKIAFANSAIKALAILKQHPVDFIISDWCMKNMDGVELLKMIRQNPKFCDIPFLMLTAEFIKNKIIYAIEEGVDDYLIKPISQDKLLYSVDKILNRISNPAVFSNKMKKLNKLKLQKNFDEALVLCHEILTEENQSHKVLLYQSECFLHKKKYKQALDSAQKALNIKKNGQSLDLLGRIYMAQKNYSKAIEYLKQASIMSPANISRKIEVGNVYLKLGLTKEASLIFESIKETEITDMNRVDIGAAYLSSGNIKKAGSYLDQTVDPIPETINIFNNYAIELRKLGEYSESIKQYENCLKIEPDNYIIQYNLGGVYFETKQYDKAIDALEKCLKIENNYEKANVLITHIKNMF